MIKNFLLKFNLSDKNRGFLFNTFYNFIFVGGKMGLSLLLVPLLLRVIGTEKFGIWQTILSIVTYISVLNFGYANSLRNIITKLSINQSNNSIGRFIGTTYIKVSKIVLILALVIIPFVYYFSNPNLLFLKTLISSNEIRSSLVIYISFSLLNLILGLSESVSLGMQRSSLNSFFQLMYVLLCYFIIYFFNKIVKLNLVHVSFIFGMSQSFIYLLFIIYQKYEFNLNLDFSSSISLKGTNKLSFHFFLAHLLSIIFISIDYFVISSTLGATETAKFSIINRVFFALITFFSIILIHFWNSVTDAFEKNEFKWINKTIKILYAVTVLIFIVGLIISFFQKNIINFWLGGNNLKLESLTFYLFSIYVLFHCLNAIFINLQNGLGLLKMQILTTSFAIALYLLGCYLFDVKHLGYNILIELKIGILALSIIFNSLVLKKIKA